MRIAIAGCLHESNTFVGFWTDRRCFEQGSLCWGDDLLVEWATAHHEIAGFLDVVLAAGAEPVPVGMAWATPGGPVTDTFFEYFCDRLCDTLRRVQPEGLLLALHGAMVTPRYASADTELLARVREAVDIPIAVTLDFHANVTPEMADYADILIAYQTYPHVDQRLCGQRAARLLLAARHEGRQHHTIIVKPPLFIPLLAQETEYPPMRELINLARRLEQRPGILAASVVAGFPYADVPEMGAAVMVVGDGDRASTAAAAEELAVALWERRHRLHVPLCTIPEAVTRAQQSSRLPVVLVDLGDNVGGGSAGDGTALLHELLRQHVRGWIAVFYAPEAVVAAQQAGLGRAVSVRIGGTDPRQGPPLDIQGTVRVLHDGRWEEPDPRHGGRRFYQQGPTAVLQLENDNLLVINSMRTPPFSLGQLTSLGIEPHRYRILVVKAAVAYKAAYAHLAGEIIPVDTPGPTAAQPQCWPQHFPYQRIRRPLFPLDPTATW
ncbi:MAG: M81 family metallopeptidase [Gemmataceae bacterium]|nr:M81 family metallopeptidase [Gemmataceae bacterium]MCS7269740.1 M81 family metallopeptidase [Gemmataceae bacterium]MDW8243657.1 M81 family metallopeptidase [Thermogemmata sp.]